MRQNIETKAAIQRGDDTIVSEDYDLIVITTISERIEATIIHSIDIQREIFNKANKRNKSNIDLFSKIK